MQPYLSLPLYGRVSKIGLCFSLCLTLFPFPIPSLELFEVQKYLRGKYPRIFQVSNSIPFSLSLCFTFTSFTQSLSESRFRNIFRSSLSLLYSPIILNLEVNGDSKIFSRLFSFSLPLSVSLSLFLCLSLSKTE